MIAKWTRSKGFEVPQHLAHIECLGHLNAIALDSMSNPHAVLHKLEYRAGKVLSLGQRILHLDSEVHAADTLQQWLRWQMPNYHDPFKGMAKGRYWELTLEGEEEFMAAAGLFVRSSVASPFWQLKLMHQLALLLFIYGPMSPAMAARGLQVQEAQIKGAAAALVRKGFIENGQRVYTFAPGQSTIDLRRWLMDEFEDRAPWLRTLVQNPELARQRVRERNARSR